MRRAGFPLLPAALLALLAPAAPAAAETRVPLRAPTPDELQRYAQAPVRALGAPGTIGAPRRPTHSAPGLRPSPVGVTVDARVVGARPANRGRKILTRVTLRVLGPRPTPRRVLRMLVPGGRRGRTLLRTTAWPQLRRGMVVRARFALTPSGWLMIEARRRRGGARAAWSKLGCCSFPPSRVPVYWHTDSGLPDWALNAILTGMDWWRVDGESWAQGVYVGGGPTYDILDCGTGSWTSFRDVRGPNGGAIGLGTYCADGDGAYELHTYLDYRVDYPLVETAAHEFGHGFGFDHSSDPGAVMYPVVHSASGLNGDDLNGLRTLYPGRVAFTLDGQSGIDPQGVAHAKYPEPTAIQFRLRARGAPCDPGSMWLRLNQPEAAPWLSGPSFDPSQGRLYFTVAPDDSSVCIADVDLQPQSPSDPGPGFVQFDPAGPERVFLGPQPSFVADFDRCPDDSGGAPDAIKDHFCALWAAGGETLFGAVLNDAHRWGDGWARDFDTGTAGRGAMLEGDGVGFAYAVAGGWWEAYLRAGGATGPLGHPDGRQEYDGHRNAGDAGTEYMTFERGRLTSWSAGTFVTWGEVLARWLQEGGAAGALGRPTNDEAATATSLQGTDGLAARFEHGRVVHNLAAGAAFVLEPGIGAAYDRAGGAAGYLGQPVGDAQDVSGGRRQEFEGGYVLDDGDGARTDHEVARPTAAVSYAPAEPVSAQTVTFTSHAAHPYDELDLDWDLDDDGDFDDASGTEAHRQFAAPGEYEIHLRAIDGDGEADIASTTVTVGNAPPAAGFDVAPQTPLTGEVVTFTSTSSDVDGVVAEQAWDLDANGEYDDAAGRSAARAFDAPGTYAIRLRATDDDGAFAIAVRAVTVAAPPPPPNATGQAPPPPRNPLVPPGPDVPEPTPRVTPTPRGGGPSYACRRARQRRNRLVRLVGVSRRQAASARTRRGRRRALARLRSRRARLADARTQVVWLC